jgi:uncharacterized protein YjbI with pentapeptide repeats
LRPLTPESFAELHAALLDAFRDTGEFDLLFTALGTSLQAETVVSSLPVLAKSLIEYALKCDKLTELVKAAKAQNRDNKRLAAIEPADLHEIPATETVVDTGEGAKPFKDRLKATLGDLEVEGMQVLVGRELLDLLDGATDDEAATLYLSLLGNVKLDRPDAIVSEIAPAIAGALRRLLASGIPRADLNLDLARSRLRRIDLSGLDLHEADLAFADLRHAKLGNTNMWRVLGYAVDVSKAALAGANLEEARWHTCRARETQFHDCRMTSAVLKEADLSGAEFFGSRLQGAHLERATLLGASFEGANLADAFFAGAKLDDAAVKSLSRALNWQKAHFDPEIAAAVAAHA